METTSTAIVVAPPAALVPPPRRTYPKGTWLKMTSFDPYGFCGRERHPSSSDVGFFGRVEKVSVSVCDDEGCLLSHDEDAPDGTELAGECSYACYLVRAHSGRLLDLMDHEVEVLDLGPGVTPV